MGPIDTYDGPETAERSTLQSALMALGRRISDAEEIMGISQPVVNGSTEKTPPIGKIDLSTKVIEELIRKMDRINDALRGL